jgi:hypothetical protein
MYPLRGKRAAFHFPYTLRHLGLIYKQVVEKFPFLEKT